MPVLTISQNEKSVLQKYVDNIHEYLDSTFLKYFPNNRLPNAAKISRIHIDEHTQPIRFVILSKNSLDDNEPSLRLPLSHLDPDDNELILSHSCTSDEFNNELYFHQNVYDIPNECPEYLSTKQYNAYKNDVTNVIASANRVNFLLTNLSAKEIEEMEMYDVTRQKLENIDKTFSSLNLTNESEFHDFYDYLTALEERDNKISQRSYKQLKNDNTYYSLEETLITAYNDVYGTILAPHHYTFLMQEQEKLDGQILAYQSDFEPCLTNEQEQTNLNLPPEQLADYYNKYVGFIDKKDAIYRLHSKLADYVELLNQQSDLRLTKSQEQLKIDDIYCEIDKKLADYDDTYFPGIADRTPNYQEQLNKKFDKLSIIQENLDYYIKLLQKQDEIRLEKSLEQLTTDEDYWEIKLTLAGLNEQFSYWIDDTRLSYMDFMELSADELKQIILNINTWKEEEFEKVQEQLTENILNYEKEKSYYQLWAQMRKYELKTPQEQLDNEATYCKDLKKIYDGRFYERSNSAKTLPTKYASDYYYLHTKDIKRHVRYILLKQRVKLVENVRGDVFVINRRQSHDLEHVLKINAVQQNKYFSFYRTAKNGDHVQIEIQPHQGISLSVFLATIEVSDSVKDKIAYAVLQAYIQQVFSHNIVHTDISTRNICIKKEGEDIKISIIDFRESFYIDSDNTLEKIRGTGSMGFQPPEFFNNAEDYATSLELNRNMRAHINLLKSNYKHLCSSAADIYALGCVLIDHIKLPNTSPYYSIGIEMKGMNPESRPTGDNIRVLLDDINQNTAHTPDLFHSFSLG